MAKKSLNKPLSASLPSKFPFDVTLSLGIAVHGRFHFSERAVKCYRFFFDSNFRICFAPTPSF
jgi:hypothetical protein